MEKIDKGCNEFCIKAQSDTVTRTAGILINSQLKAQSLEPAIQPILVVAGLTGSNNPRWLKADLVVCVNPSSSSL